MALYIETREVDMGTSGVVAGEPLSVKPWHGFFDFDPTGTGLLALSVTKIDGDTIEVNAEDNIVPTRRVRAEDINTRGYIHRYWEFGRRGNPDRMFEKRLVWEPLQAVKAAVR